MGLSDPTKAITDLKHLQRVLGLLSTQEPTMPEEHKTIFEMGDDNDITLNIHYVGVPPEDLEQFMTRGESFQADENGAFVKIEPEAQDTIDLEEDECCGEVEEDVPLDVRSHQAVDDMLTALTDYEDRVRELVATNADQNASLERLAAHAGNLQQTINDESYSNDILHSNLKASRRVCMFWFLVSVAALTILAVITL